MGRVTRAEREMEQLLQLAGLRDDLRKVAAERDQLRAEVERLRGCWTTEQAESGRLRDVCGEKTREYDLLRYRFQEVEKDREFWLKERAELIARAEAATDRAEAAEGRAAGLYRALCDAVRASGGVANEGISDTFLILGVPAEMAARKKAQEAAEAHVADLRGALEQVDKLAVAHSPQMAGKVSLRMMHAGMSEALHGVKAALSRTPAQSLARVKAAALREAASELESLRDHIQDYIAPDDARDDIRRICLNRAKDLRSEADLLQKEAANDPR